MDQKRTSWRKQVLRATRRLPATQSTNLQLKTTSEPIPTIQVVTGYPLQVLREILLIKYNISHSQLRTPLTNQKRILWNRIARDWLQVSIDYITLFSHTQPTTTLVQSQHQLQPRKTTKHAYCATTTEPDYPQVVSIAWIRAPKKSSRTYF